MAMIALLVLTLLGADAVIMKKTNPAQDLHRELDDTKADAWDAASVAALSPADKMEFSKQWSEAAAWAAKDAAKHRAENFPKEVIKSAPKEHNGKKHDEEESGAPVQFLDETHYLGA